MMRNYILLSLCLLLAFALTACPTVDQVKSVGTNASSDDDKLAAEGIAVSLVRSDLGLGDGCFVREVDALLADLAKEGLLTYQPIGDLPAEMIIEATTYDVGLPVEGSNQPGAMTSDSAIALLDDVQSCDWLILSSPVLVDSAIQRITEGAIEAQAVILLDEEGWNERPENPAIPIISVRYSIKDVAFLLGVAVAQSANNQQFVAMANSSDPQAEEFLEAVSRGAKYQTNGAVTLTATLDVDPETGLVSPSTFRETIEQIKERAGQAYAANHFVLALGRATPTIMYAMTQNPINGYVLGAYADYRQIRPARVVGCGLKHPAVAVRYLLENAATVEELQALAPGGYIELGMDDGAVGFTDFELYSRYNPDGDDIQQAVETRQNQIQAGEMDDYEY